VHLITCGFVQSMCLVFMSNEDTQYVKNPSCLLLFLFVETQKCRNVWKTRYQFGSSVPPAVIAVPVHAIFYNVHLAWCFFFHSATNLK